MHDRQVLALLAGFAGDLQGTAGVRRNRDSRAGLLDILHLSAAQTGRHLGLRQVVCAGRAAAEFRLRQVVQFQSRH